MADGPPHTDKKKLFEAWEEVASNHYAALGIVASNWAIFETTIDIWNLKLANIPRQFGAVRRQSFWDRRRLKIRESLARLVCDVMQLADGDASGDW